MSVDIKQLETIIIAAAREELLPRFTKVTRGHKADGSVITEADLAMQQRVASELHALSPDIVFLGEEMNSEEQIALLGSGKSVWCLDPLDGTSNFSTGIPYFSVSLALIENGQVTAGIVYDPVRNECFSATLAESVTLNGQKIETADSGLDLKQSTGLVDFKRLPAELAQRLYNDTPYSSQRSFGSVALDWCWLAVGRSHVYLHGKQNIWDYAAGNFIFHEAGGYSTTLDGEPIFVNELKPRSAVGALDRKLFDQWTAWLGITPNL